MELLMFWKNAEFIRHRRANLRTGRMLAITAIVAVLCYLAGMGIHSSVYGGLSDAETQRRSAELLHDFGEKMFWTVFGCQTGLLILYSLGTCIYAIAAEREKKTFDFLRTTAQSPAELMVGKLLGTPVVGWFTFLVATPISLVMGFLAGFSVPDILLMYILAVIYCLLIGLAAMTASVQMERVQSGGVSVVAVIFLFWLFGAIVSEMRNDAHFSGLAALLLFPVFFSFSSVSPKDPMALTLFGTHVHGALVALFIYLTAGAWFVLAIVRNMKSDFDDVRLFNRVQGLGLLLYLNFLYYALFDPEARGRFIYASSWSAKDLTYVILGFNIFMIGAIGVMMLTTPEHFKVWWRNWRSGSGFYVSESGPVWPWLLLYTLPGILCYAAYALGTSALGPLANWPIAHAAEILLVFVVFIVRDILFLQSTLLTRMKRPLIKGVLLLCLYYFAALIFVATMSVGSPKAGQPVAALLTPFGIVDEQMTLLNPFVVVGLILQIGLSAVLLFGMHQRLSRKAITPPSTQAVAAN